MSHPREVLFSCLLASNLLLSACAGPVAKKNDILDIYDLPRAQPGQTIYVTPVDNDTYYTRPGGYRGCAQIGDSPSCGGG